MARAEYIMFVDGDDWVKPEYCEVPYQIAVRKQADVVCFRNYNHQKGYRTRREKPFRKEGWITEKDALLIKEESQIWKQTDATVWNKLYRKNLFAIIRYPVGYVYEDVVTTHKIMHEAGKVWLLNRYLYYHRTGRPGSITSTISLKTKKIVLMQFLSCF